jgi:tetratricopeptide (TPR) repeat protein
VIPPDPLAASLAAVDEKLAERRAQGDLAGVADAQARRAFVFFEAERYAEADGQMAEAVDLYKEAGDTKGRGETQLARAMILSQLPGRENDTRACLDSAKALGRLAGDVVTEMKARQRITNLSESAGDWKAAETEVTRMIARVKELGLDRGVVDTHRHRGTIRMALGNPNASLQDFERALEAAERVGDPQQTLMVRIERRAVQTVALAGADEVEPYSSLLADATALGDTGFEATVELQQAAEMLRAGRNVEGLAQAIDARDSALAAPNPILYTVACLLIAEARENLRDYVGVLEILLSCKATLEHALGHEAGKQVNLVLESLRTKWGEDVLAEAREGYRSWAREEMARRGPPT